jgi:hypothetical protein
MDGYGIGGWTTGSLKEKKRRDKKRFSGKESAQTNHRDSKRLERRPHPLAVGRWPLVVARWPVRHPSSYPTLNHPQEKERKRKKEKTMKRNDEEEEEEEEEEER